MHKKRNAILASSAIFGVALSGCSSHLLSSGFDDGTCAAGECMRSQVSIAGRSGISSNAATGAIPIECGNRGFTRVEVRRTFGQGLATVLTLGLVNPATLHFACVKAPQQSEIVCNSIPGVDGVIECVRRSTDTQPEAVRFDCEITPTDDDPEAIAEFTCKPSQAALDRLLPLIKSAEQARG